MFSTLIKLNDLLDKKSKRLFVLLFILLLIKSLFDGFGLGLIAPYITAISDVSLIFDNELFKKINVITNIETKRELILLMSILLIGFFLFKNIFSLFVMYFQSRLVFTKRSIQGKELFDAYMNAPYSYHLEHNTAELDRNIRFESTNVYGFVQSFLLLCSSVFLTISIFIILMVANWQAVLWMGIFIILISSIFLFISGKYSKIYGVEVQESQLHIGQAMKEGLSSVIESKLHNIESFFPSRYFKNMMSNAKANWRQATLATAPALFFEILAVSTLAVVIMVLSTRTTDLINVLPILGLFSFAFIRLIPSVTDIIKSLQQIKFLAPAVNVVHADFITLGNLSKEKRQNHQSNNKTIKFENLLIDSVNFSFPSKKNINVIDKISLMIKKGQAVGITGPSGSGKTTLINLILGLLNPKNGRICVNNKNIQDNISNWQSLIGYVPQHITLTDASIKENIALGLQVDKIDDDRIWTVLEEANLTEFVKDLPKQLNTLIGENGMRLSGGQRQRLGLARAMYRDPEVLIFDEATSSLDVETEKRITHEIMKMSGKRTLIIVAHRTTTIKDCDVIYYLKNGEILNSGKFDEIKELKNNIKELKINTEA